jgi:hypothetical protein
MLDSGQDVKVSQSSENKESNDGLYRIERNPSSYLQQAVAYHHLVSWGQVAYENLWADVSVWCDRPHYLRRHCF